MQSKSVGRAHRPMRRDASDSEIASVMQNSPKLPCGRNNVIVVLLLLCQKLLLHFSPIFFRNCDEKKVFRTLRNEGGFFFSRKTHSSAKNLIKRDVGYKKTWILFLCVVETKSPREKFFSLNIQTTKRGIYFSYRGQNDLRLAKGKKNRVFLSFHGTMWKYRRSTSLNQKFIRSIFFCSTRRWEKKDVNLSINQSMPKSEISNFISFRKYEVVIFLLFSFIRD